MPLISSPIDGSPMRQIKRYGIEIDVCPTSGGIWMDRGELEKLMALLREEATNDESGHRNHDGRSHNFNKRKDDDDYDDDYSYNRRGDQQHKKSKMSRMLDIFDF